MNSLKMFLLAMLLSLAGYAYGWDEQAYRQIEASIEQPHIVGRDYVVTAFGASVKGSARQNQQAICRAIDQASKHGGGRVVIPKGTFVTGAIRLKSHVNLSLAEGATLRFAFAPALYPMVKTAWEGLGCWNYSPCIYAYQVTDVAITGLGTIDGNGSNNTWWPWCGAKKFGFVAGQTKESQSYGSRDRLQRYAEDGVSIDDRRFGPGQGLRPQLIHFNECERILVKGVRLINSPFWVIHPLLSKNITIDGVTIWNEGPNGDGCDPEACDGVLIQNTVFHTGDDCIAIKSGRNNDGRLWNRPSRNIIIRNCKMEDGHGGVVIGSEISGGCENVYAENCHMDSPNLERVLRIKTNNCRGGLIQNINMRNVTVGQCREAVLRINLDYESKEQCYRGFEPTVRQVSMENVTCQKSQYGVQIIGLNNIENVYDIHLKNCHFNGVSRQPVSVTGKTRNVTYDNVSVNGSLILADADRPYRNYSEWMTYSEMQRTPRSYLLDFSTKPKWSYVMGIEMEGMLDTYFRYGGDTILNYLMAYPAKMIGKDGKVTGYTYADFNLDNVRTAKLVQRLYELQPKAEWQKALDTFYKQLQHQPRTHDGVYWHKAIYANQVWLDGIFMGLPYYTRYAATYLKGKKQRKVFNDVVDQIMKTDIRTYDPKTNLWKHAWDETHSQFWADKSTGQSQHTWARALGWYTMAMIEVLDALPANDARRAELIQLLNKTMKSVVHYQDKTSGVWFDVMDVTDHRNYLESTASCMFAYVLLKGSRLGYLDSTYRQAGFKAYEGIVHRFIRVNADKTISLTDCCAVSGLGPGPGPYVKKPNLKRDGSFEYYMSEPVRDNDAKGIGPFIWASLEVEGLNNGL